MENIGNFIDINTSIENGLVLIKLKLLNAEITKLRALKMTDQVRKLLQELRDPRIKTFVMIFDISNLKIVQKEYIDDVIELFKSSKPMFHEKLKCSCIIMNNIIAVPMKMILSKFYEPIKPLFICGDEDECRKYIFMDEDNDEFLNSKFVN
jgi:hypothetical protein